MIDAFKKSLFKYIQILYTLNYYVNAGQPPEIKVPEKSLINESLGDRTNLTCFFTGFPTPIILWRKDGAILQSSDDIKIKTNK